MNWARSILEILVAYHDENTSDIRVIRSCERNEIFFEEFLIERSSSRQ